MDTDSLSFELKNLISSLETLEVQIKKLEYQNREIKMWRERYLSEKPLLKPCDAANIWMLFLSVPSQAICEDGINTIYDTILTTCTSK